ncbi:hypothetical protein L195_g045598, partial [Trifolium pratense]
RCSDAKVSESEAEIFDAGKIPLPSFQQFPPSSTKDTSVHTIIPPILQLQSDIPAEPTALPATNSPQPVITDNQEPAVSHKQFYLSFGPNRSGSSNISDF